MPNIILHIEAENIQDLRQKVANALGDTLVPPGAQQAPYTTAKHGALMSSPLANAGTLKVEEAARAEKFGGKPTPLSAQHVPNTGTLIAKAAASVVEEAAERAPSTTDGLDYDRDVKPKVLEISKKYQREGVMELLAPFGVANAKLVPAERYQELVEAADKILARG